LFIFVSQINTKFMPANQNRSIPRTKAREAEKKLMPAIKAISTSVHKTGIVPDKFLGYKVPAGELTDKLGRKWQYQIIAVVAKSEFIKRDEVVPMLKGWAWMIKAKALIKYVIDQVNK
jgi:hypothetical protein